MSAPATAVQIPGLHASAPHPLPFAPALGIRAFRLGRDAGDLLVYSAPAVGDVSGVQRQYLNHWHEAAFGGEATGVPLFCNEHDRVAVERSTPVAHVFSKRHVIGSDFEVIPTPGHTPGATAYLWETGEHRMLFTGDTLYLDEGEWVAAVLESSDRAAYIESLALMRELDFDVLVPWAASGDEYLAPTDVHDARRRLDAIIARLRRGENR
jgi:glyoxylase-like metal-dependent hydrolase (beta-lactamase superfamily II)